MQVKSTKISYIGTLFEVPFIQDSGLLIVRLRLDSLYNKNKTQTLENTEGVIRNGQSRCHTGYKTENEDNEIKKTRCCSRSPGFNLTSQSS